jgi:hypothetical protein
MPKSRSELTCNQLMVLLDIYRGTLNEHSTNYHMATIYDDLKTLFKNTYITFPNLSNPLTELSCKTARSLNNIKTTTLSRELVGCLLLFTTNFQQQHPSALSAVNLTASTHLLTSLNTQNLTSNANKTLHLPAVV